MPRHTESYRESDSFALNQKDIFGTKRTVSVNSDTILYYFYSSALSNSL